MEEEEARNASNARVLKVLRKRVSGVIYKDKEAYDEFRKKGKGILIKWLKRDS